MNPLGVAVAPKNCISHPAIVQRVSSWHLKVLVQLILGKSQDFLGLASIIYPASSRRLAEENAAGELFQQWHHPSSMSGLSHYLHRRDEAANILQVVPLCLVPSVSICVCRNCPSDSQSMGLPIVQTADQFRHPATGSAERHSRKCYCMVHSGD